MKKILAATAVFILVALAIAIGQSAQAATVSWSPDPKTIAAGGTGWADINVAHTGDDLGAVTFWFSHAASVSVLGVDNDGLVTEPWQLVYAGTVSGYPNTYYIQLIGDGIENCLADNSFTAIRVRFQVGSCGTGGALDWIEGGSSTYLSTCTLNTIIPTYDDGYVGATACPPPCNDCELDKGDDAGVRHSTWAATKALWK